MRKTKSAIATDREAGILRSIDKQLVNLTAGVSAAQPPERPITRINVTPGDIACVTGTGNGQNRDLFKLLIENIWPIVQDSVGNASISGTDNPDRWQIQAATTLLAGLDPKSPMEALLGVQIFVTNQLSMRSASRSLNPDAAISERHFQRFERLSRLLLAQMEAMQKLKGLSGHQKVTVEHLHVEAGGKAVVGQVLTGLGEGEGGIPQK